MDAIAWERLMAQVCEAAAEEADYSPGNLLAPGSGREGDSPLGEKYAKLGPLAFVLNEALDSAVNVGSDRDALIEQIAHLAGEDTTPADINDVLAGKVTCPPPMVFQAFANSLAIDANIILDAAIKGGCKGYTGEPMAVPPGMP